MTYKDIVNDGEKEAYNEGRADALKDELKFLKGKNMKQCLKYADYGACHEIPTWLSKRIDKLEKQIQGDKKWDNQTFQTIQDNHANQS